MLYRIVHGSQCTANLQSGEEGSASGEIR
jgi:hypothetical protein